MKQQVTAATRLTELKTALLMYTPFFGSIMYDMMTLQPLPDGNDKGIDTAGTDGKNLYINEKFITSISLMEGLFVLCHEIAHAMWMHMDRAKTYEDLGFEGQKFSPMLYNIAADYVINDMLVVTKVGAMPKCALHSPEFSHEMSAEEVYRALLKKFPPKPQKSTQVCEDDKPADGGNSGEGSGGDSGEDSEGGSGEERDDSVPPELADKQFDKHIPTPAKSSEGEWKRAVESARSSAKAAGMLPAALERFADKFLNPQVPWNEKLRFFVSRAIANDTKSWDTPHRRRLVTQRLFYPRNRGFSAGEVVVAVDTSGSITDKILTVFFSELAEIIDTCRPEATWVLGIDAAVNSVERFEPGHDIRTNPPKVKGGGGTSFIPAFDWCDQEGIVPTTLIYLTDLYGTYPDEAPAYPVIWCCISGETARWGETIHINEKGA